MLIDTHAHLNFPDYQKDLDKTIKRSVKAGVKKIICVSSSIADSQKSIEIAKKYKGVVFAAVGIHPQITDPENKEILEKQVKKLEKLAKDRRVVAIGECGLDYSLAAHGEENRLKSEQFFLLKAQIKLAKKLNLPLIIHSRKAFKDTVKILEEQKPLKGVFHCFSAGKKGIIKVNNLNFYFGLDGNITYEQGLQNVVQKIPLEKILLETDCPFLSPEPKRGKRNEPANIRIIASFLATLKRETIKKIAQRTTQNAKDLFRI